MIIQRYLSGLFERRAIYSVSLVVISLFMMLTLSGCLPEKGKSTDVSNVHEAALQEIVRNKVIKVGWAPYAPYISGNPVTKVPEGYYVDLFDILAKESDLKVEWVETTWGNMITDIKNGKFHVMGSPIFRTINRAKSVEFTRSIGYFGLSAIVRKEEAIAYPSSIYEFNTSDVKVAVTQGEVGHEFVMRNLPDAKSLVKPGGDISLALVDVIQGKADIGIADAWTIKQFADAHQDAVVNLYGSTPFGKVGAGWFVRADEDDLRTFLNTSIDWLESSGSLEKVASGYEGLPEISIK